MKTSTAGKNNYECPECGDDLTRDRKGQGFVRHKSNPDCDYVFPLFLCYFAETLIERRHCWPGLQAELNTRSGLVQGVF